MRPATPIDAILTPLWDEASTQERRRYVSMPTIGRRPPVVSSFQRSAPPADCRPPSPLCRTRPPPKSLHRVRRYIAPRRGVEEDTLHRRPRDQAAVHLADGIGGHRFVRQIGVNRAVAGVLDGSVVESQRVGRNADPVPIEVCRLHHVVARSRRTSPRKCSWYRSTSWWVT